VRQVGIAVSAVVVVLVGVGVALFLWLRAYEPLEATGPYSPGSGLGADVEPTFGSGGKTVFIPTYQRPREFTTRFVLANTGRFAVTVLGVEHGDGPIEPIAGSDEQVRIDPHDSTSMLTRWRLDCGRTKKEVAADRLRIRYRYLSAFTRTATVELPFAVTVRCSGGPPASP
jgi:hypothetical protein